ncbi:MAG: hypothetical protein KDC91_09515 [Flavobacteriaceae bacterium]|nr:hypothetical protein [Flavobacteriaceae bacterium]
MKNLIKIHFLALLSLVLLFGSCQKEDKEFIDETDGEETFTANSTITGLLRSASQNNGTQDNIIDGSSCFSVVFPIEVFANGQKLLLQTLNDVSQVQAIFDQFPSDNDTLEIVFPIQLVSEDFSVVTVNNQTEFNSVISDCVNSIVDTYACVDFVYPINCFVYNNNNEQTGTITLNSAYEWFEYLIYLQEGIYIAIDYPMSVIVNGQTITVNTNQELTNAISQADCSNDDGSSTNPTDFENYLTTGVWYVTYFFDDYDETSDFADYEFTFAVDGSAEASNSSGTTPGNWDFYVDSGVDKVDLYFGTVSPLDEIDEDWEILEATNDIIRLKHISGGDGSVDFLTYERTPYSGGGGNTNPFIENLVNGSWYINLLNDDGNDETCDYVEYEFVYNLNGTVTATSPSNTKNGFWTVTDSSSGLDLVLNFDVSGTNDPFEDLNDDWDVTNYDATIIQLMDVSGGNGGTDYLDFGRNPHTGCGGGGQGLSDILLNGPWFVQTYLDDGVDETYDYYGYTLTFNSGGAVVATNGTNTFNGTWSVTTSTTPDLILDFGTQVPFDEFNDDWDVLSYTETTINLEDVSGGGGGTDTLIFQKL